MGPSQPADADHIAEFLLKPPWQACKEFSLIEEGDRGAVAVPGGKDSRALLELLLRHQRQAPIRYGLLALHVVGAQAELPDI